MPKYKYPDEPGTTGRGEKEPLFPYQEFGTSKPRYGTFGFVDGKHEYGQATINNIYHGVFIFNEAGCKLFAQAFPGFAIQQIIDTLNKEFEDPLSNGYSHGLDNCKFTGDSINNIQIHSKRGFIEIEHSSAYLEATQKGYAIDIGKNVVDKIFEDLIPYLERKAEENAHLVRTPPPKGRPNNTL
jgi:hypothetical protein